MSDFEEDFMMSEEEDDDFSLVEDEDDENFGEAVVTTTKSKKKTTSTKVLGNATNKSTTTTSSKSAGIKKKKAVEDTYQKLTPHEHILKRPDTYIGSVEPQEFEWYVLESSKIGKKKIRITPGMYKIFDEIVVNAADNKQRDPDMDKLDITIEPEENRIIVRNNGKGIPVVKHTQHNVYVPTLIFGHLLTGSNFDDDEKKTTGGRNGYGAKLANIFSTRFEVHCVDVENGLKFHQVFTNNMKNVQEPTVKKLTKSEIKKGDFVQVTFHPDLERFKMTHLDEDTVRLLEKRAYDVAGTLASSNGKKLAVTLNKSKLPIKCFKDYLGCFDTVKVPSAYERVNERWEVGVGPSAEDGSALQHISFVNGICTTNGGEHVNYIANQVITHLSAVLKKKNKGTEVSKTHIRNHLFIFVNCLIENPAFSSQTKEQLTTRSKAFGSECKVSAKFLKQVEKCGVVDEILSFAKFRQTKAMKRHGGVKKSKLTGIPKLDDANHAGTAKSHNCTLIVTEGDSAKSLAMSGLSVVGRDTYGVFPLKGKPLNVREASQAAVVKNEEIKNLVDILGLKFGTVYTEENIKTLRYGSLMIMADQDHDGSHIKGLIINMIHFYWPGLLDIAGFLKQFITPIVKATKGKKESITFFTLPEYLNWKDSANGGKGYKIKYYKGLGTSTSQEAKEYFSNLDLHEIEFGQISEDRKDSQPIVSEEEKVSDEDDMEFEVTGNNNNNDNNKPITGSDLIDMCFSKARVDDRKSWLSALEKDTYLNYAEAQTIHYSDFVNKELILFSQADNQRSIPHIMDGFKPSQRKVLFSCIKRKLKLEIKVAQLAGYVSEHSAYHHGEMSLTGTIIGMAQNFVGSNNVNLLTPSGQFGTRRMGGKDSASPRYVFTKLENITRKIYHPDDDALLSYLNEDGLKIEPEYYVPVIPMALVNGSEGIGTGWSSSVPNFSPRQIIRHLRRMIEGKEGAATEEGENGDKLVPHYHGFVGDIIPEIANKYKVHGKIERRDDTTLHISELPLKKWTQDYKVFLEGMLNGNPVKKQEPEIKDFMENHTDATVSFTITTATKEQIDAFEKTPKGGLHAKFKLTNNLSTSNMNLFNPEGRITKYLSPEAILQQFFGIRLDYYSRRKDLLLKKLKYEQKMLTNKARFVEEVCSGDLVVSNRKRKDILHDLRDRGYDLMDKEQDGNGISDTDEEADVEVEQDDSTLAKGYEYLLGMKIWSLTYEKAEELRRQVAEKNQQVDILTATSPSQIWCNDLDEIEEALDDRDKELRQQELEEVEAMAKSKKGRGATKKKKVLAKKKPKKKIVKDDDDESMTQSDYEEPVKPKKKVIRKAPATKRNHSTKKKMEEESILAKTLQDKLMVSPPPKKSRSRLQTNEEINEPSMEIPIRALPQKEDDGDDSEDSFLKTRPPPKKKNSGGGRRKKVVDEDDEDDEDDFSMGDGDSSDSDVAIVPRAPAPRARRGRRKITYTVASDSDDSDF